MHTFLEIPVGAPIAALCGVNAGLWMQGCGCRAVDTGLWIQGCGYRAVDSYSYLISL